MKLSPMDTAQRQIEALNDVIERASWFGRPPFKPARMTEAVALVEQNPNLVIALVAWWGNDEDPLPTGWTWVDALEKQPGGWQVMLDTEPSPRLMFIPADDVVMLFRR